MMRTVTLGLLGHGSLCASLLALDAGSVRLPLWAPAVLVLVAIAAASAARRLVPATGGTAVAVGAAMAWFILGVAHHYLIGITPRWAGEPAQGLRHVAWDLAFHAPPMLLVAVALRRSPEATD